MQELVLSSNVKNICFKTGKYFGSPSVALVMALNLIEEMFEVNSLGVQSMGV